MGGSRIPLVGCNLPIWLRATVWCSIETRSCFEYSARRRCLGTRLTIVRAVEQNTSFFSSAPVGGGKKIILILRSGVKRMSEVYLFGIRGHVVEN